MVIGNIDIICIILTLFIPYILCIIMQYKMAQFAMIICTGISLACIFVFRYLLVKFERSCEINKLIGK